MKFCLIVHPVGDGQFGKIIGKEKIFVLKKNDICTISVKSMV